MIIKIPQGSFADLPELRIPGDCSPGALKRNAALLKEISDRDVETLFLETGVSFRLDL